MSAPARRRSLPRAAATRPPVTAAGSADLGQPQPKRSRRAMGMGSSCNAARGSTSAATAAEFGEPPSQRTRGASSGRVPTVRLVMRTTCPDSCPSSEQSAAGIAPSSGFAAGAAPRPPRQVPSCARQTRGSMGSGGATAALPRQDHLDHADALSDGGQDVAEVRCCRA